MTTNTPTIVNSITDLEALYGATNPASIDKVMAHITPHYKTWIEASKFLILSTIGPEGTDASPRGDDGPVVKILDAKTILLPDWSGNNRLDSLKNIVRDDRISLMFMIPGIDNIVRVNGTAQITPDEAITHQFAKDGKTPKSVIIVTVSELYFQCAKALMRSKLWDSGKEAIEVPTAGDFVKEFKADFDGKAYDDGYAEHAKKRMW
jgi:PPOX class probable FMN-dependent enzyme